MLGKTTVSTDTHPLRTVFRSRSVHKWHIPHKLLTAYCTSVNTEEKAIYNYWLSPVKPVQIQVTVYRFQARGQLKKHVHNVNITEINMQH